MNLVLADRASETCSLPGPPHVAGPGHVAQAPRST